jgi:hypothetical protein
MAGARLHYFIKLAARIWTSQFTVNVNICTVHGTQYTELATATRLSSSPSCTCPFFLLLHCHCHCHCPYCSSRRAQSTSGLYSLFILNRPGQSSSAGLHSLTSTRISWPPSHHVDCRTKQRRPPRCSEKTDRQRLASPRQHSLQLELYVAHVVSASLPAQGHVLTSLCASR